MSDSTPLLEVKFGSHLYGTDTPDSDLDLKTIFIPSARDILLGRGHGKVVTTTRRKAPGERNSKDDVDVEMFSLDRFLSDLMDGQTWALDVLFAYGNGRATCPTKRGEILMGVILRSRDALLSRNVNAFVGYARKQAARYGIKGSRMDAVRRVCDVLAALPGGDRLDEYRIHLDTIVDECRDLVSLERSPLVEIIKQPSPGGPVPHLHVCGRMLPLRATVKLARETYGRILAEYGERSRKANLAGGVDWKALSHAVRVNGEAVELLSTGWITFPRPDRAILVEIKTGQRPAEEVYALIEEGLATLTATSEASTLRAEPDRAFADELVHDAYQSQVVYGPR